ncbi:MAG: FKBP-type peptidyl-prolyl cis-trans isomerase [Lachnospiraceae bacterium]|nr:FKBP-type peptidyl-prolyl cis-trans isomerase [Lachnospiraceae bacterium]
MKKKILFPLFGLTAALLLTACGSSDTGSGSSGSTSSDSTVTETEAATEAQTEDSISSVVPSDYLVENAADYITTDGLEGLEVTQYTYEITDEMLQEQIDQILSQMSDETDVDRAAEMGDLVYVELSCTVGEDDDSYSENTYFTLGEADYGDEFDAALVGAAAGETVTFDITYDEDAADETLIEEDWAGQTVHFEVEISSVCEITMPEYNDDWAAENTEYATTEEYETALRESLEEEYEEQSYADVLDDLLTLALANCEISEIPDDLYEASREEILNDYASFADSTDEAEILDLFDMTEDDLETEAQTLAQRRLLISYICVENEIELSGTDYVAYLEEYAAYYGYDTAEDFEEDWGRSYLVWSMYESEAAEILYNSASITTEAYEDILLTDEEADELEAETAAADEESSDDSEAETVSAAEEAIPENET